MLFVVLLLVSVCPHLRAINCTNTFHLNEWWVYEWCDQTHVRQVHLSAPRGIILQEYILNYETSIQDDATVRGTVYQSSLCSTCILILMLCL